MSTFPVGPHVYLKWTYKFEGSRVHRIARRNMYISFEEANIDPKGLRWNHRPGWMQIQVADEIWLNRRF